MYSLVFLLRQDSADDVFTQYAKAGQTTTAYDPYPTGFQYIIDSFIAPKYGDYIYIGCYGDNVDDRALKGNFSNVGTGSIELCAGFCQGYTFFGLENGNECWYQDIWTALNQLISQRLLRQSNGGRC